MKERIILGVLCLPVIAVGLCNAWYNKSFWELSVGNIFNLIVALLVSFILVQRRTDVRKKKDTLEKIINKIEQELVSLMESSFDSNVELALFTMQNRRISNKIDIINKYSKDYGYVEEMHQFSKLFDEYRDFLGENFPSLSTKQKDLKRPIQLMDDMLDKIKIKLCQ